MGILQNLQKFRLRVRKCCRTHRSSGYSGTGVPKLQKFRAGIKMLYPYPGYLWHGRTELAEVPGMGMNVVRTYRSSGYGCECPTELTEVLCRVIPGVNTPGMVLYVPYKTQPLKVAVKFVSLIHWPTTHRAFVRDRTPPRKGL